MQSESIILEVNKLYKKFHNGKKINHTYAVSDVSFKLSRGEIIGIVGKNGCGKTTTALCISGLLCYDRGNILLFNRILNQLSNKQKNILLRKNIQYIFQYSKKSLNPEKSIHTIFSESISSLERLTKKKIHVNYSEILKKVGLNKYILDRRPSELSGGQIQRVVIARSLLATPSILIADEAITGSDVTNQAKILNLLKSLNNDGLSIIYISHDLSTVSFLCDWIILMEKGSIIEQNKTKIIFNKPEELFTKKYISSCLNNQ